MFKPRQLLLSAYKSYRNKKLHKARKVVLSAISEAGRRGCVFDVKWAKACQGAWFGASSRDNKDEDIMFVLQ